MTDSSLWQWQTWQEKPYLTCQLLASWPHGFFTQHFAPQTPETLVMALDPQAKVFRVKQVHGNTVLTPQEIAHEMHQGDSEAILPGADGVLSDQARQAVWVASADCTPALIGDVTTGQVAAVHAGWRGTAQRILPVTVQRFLTNGSQLADLRVALGPAISGEVYQVHRQVALAVGKSTQDPGDADLAEDVYLAGLMTLAEPPLLPDTKPDHYRLDVRCINQLQLTNLGLKPEQLSIAPYCTYKNPDHFFSYRRTGAKNVQWSGIVSL
ncbi:peptidoglycan editing factor PgeF [Synechocystis sp. LKSZ1]|uniref:peptidoglycan editing factor PgeF n=1 Tax=Synechocystis sp. LKSZ1 TaxID=3144951 RepID=UPI00336BF51D